MNCMLLVNKSGLLSACPTIEDFETYNFIVDANHIRSYAACLDDDTHADLWANRDNAFIITADAPLPPNMPGRVFYQLEEGKLQRVLLSLNP